MDYELTEIDNAETGEQEELELHPEEVRQRQDTYSSLTDLSQIHLFTSEFKNRMEEKERREEDQYIELSEEVFMQAVRGKGSEELKLQLFTGEQDQKLFGKTLLSVITEFNRTGEYQRIELPQKIKMRGSC